MSAQACDVIESQPDALEVLALKPACTDEAIAALERLAGADAKVWSDVAAAYYVRAQRGERPSDLLHALDAADRATAITPPLPAAHFNRALILEQLGFPAEAIESWNEFLSLDRSQWAGEARQHRDRLVAQRELDAPLQWERTRTKLPPALRRRNPSEILALIAPFPSTAQRYLEEELLPQWAATASRDLLGDAEALAGALHQWNGDPYAADVVATIVHSSGEDLDTLRQGHLAYADARRAEHAFGIKKAKDAYDKATRLLQRAHSPLALLAAHGHTLAMSFDNVPNALDRAADLLDPIESEARARGYVHPLARIESTRGYFRHFQSRYIEALTAYDEALAAYERLRDPEGVATTHSRKSSVLNSVGQYELAWRESLLALHDLPHMVELQPRHTLLGDTAAAALSLGHANVALRYQNAAVRLIRNDLVATPPENIEHIGSLQKNLAVALRARGGIEVQLGRYGPATDDLDEATRLSDDTTKGASPNISRLLQARIQEVQGQKLLYVNAAAAIDAFTSALTLAADDDFRTFRASLFAERAEAERRAGRHADAENDLRASLAELHAEESRILATRRRGKGEEIWSSYFSRFQQTYRVLIQQLVDEGRNEEAFAYAENARAFEPLNLILQLGVVPSSFRGLAVDGTMIDLRRVQAALPRGTFIVEYCVLDDRTYCWIISRDRFSLLTLEARRADIERWTGALQQAARQRNAGTFQNGLYAPYEKLIATPVAEIAKMPDGTPPSRLVFIPDGAMQGMPIGALSDRMRGRHLIEDAPIAISASTRLYLFSLARDAEFPNTAPDVLLIGDPAFDRRLTLAADLQRLPLARREVESLFAMYAPRATMRVGEQATVPDFLARARSSTIIHIAAHAIANAETPSNSLILFAPSATHSGALVATELLSTLRLDRTRLVVLSTCSSAGGLPVGPEGVAPLVRPLLAAGVPAVIGSLWDVEDATAEELLVSFHRHYRQGSDAAEALRSAQLDLLRNKNPGLRSALAWAPFEVIGTASSPFGAPHHE